jgi:acyl carrier protein
MEEQEIQKKVIEIVADKLGVDPSEIHPESAFVRDLGADSLDVVELIMALEDEFGLTIEEEEAEKIETIRDAVRYIQENV